MSKLFSWYHRIHTTEQARICRRTVMMIRQQREIERLREEVEVARELNQQAAANLIRQTRNQEIIVAVLKMDSNLSGDTGVHPVVKPKGGREEI